MGQKKSRYSSSPPLDVAILRRITSATSFLPDEIQYFYYDFLKYTPKGYLTRADFEKFYQTLFRHGIPENFARYAFDAYDTNQDDRVDFEEFITGLYYTTKASSNEKIQWAFDLCDQDDIESNELRNSITKSEFVDIIQNDTNFMKLIDYQPIASKRASKFENSTATLLKKTIEIQTFNV